MRRPVYVSLAMLGLAAGWQLRAQSPLQAQLEVNLGPLAIDVYNGTQPNSEILVASGPNSAACSYTAAGSNYRNCMQQVLGLYASQGVVGVKIYFGMGGNDANSTPFVNLSGAIGCATLK